MNENARRTLSSRNTISEEEFRLGGSVNHHQIVYEPEHQFRNSCKTIPTISNDTHAGVNENKKSLNDNDQFYRPIQSSFSSLNESSIERRLRDVEQRIESHTTRLKLSEDMIRLKEQDCVNSNDSTATLSRELDDRVSRCERMCSRVDTAILALEHRLDCGDQLIAEKIDLLEKESLKHAHCYGALVARAKSSETSENTITNQIQEAMKCIQDDVDKIEDQTRTRVENMEQRIVDMIDMFRSIEAERRAQYAPIHHEQRLLRQDINTLLKQQHSPYVRESFSILEDEVRTLKRKFIEVVRAFNAQQTNSHDVH